MDALRIGYVDGPRLRRTLLAACEHARRQRRELNRINVFPVPDGDTGTNLTLTLEAIVHHLRDNRTHGSWPRSPRRGRSASTRPSCRAPPPAARSAFMVEDAPDEEA